MKKKYYAVKAGRTTGIFTDWQKCKESVIGFSGAIYKSFTEEAEALSFFNSYSSDIQTDNNSDEFYLSIYTDGAYNNSLLRYGYGAVIIDENEKEHYLQGYGDNNHLIKSRNVTGELLAVLNALQWAKENNYNYVKIFHDYAGCSEWINGKWKASEPVSQAYISSYNFNFKNIKLSFVKIKGHSGDKYNDYADFLAGEAIKNSIRGDERLLINYCTPTPLA